MIFQPLLDIINNTRSGSPNSISITYTIDKGISKEILQGVKLDLHNAMFQWENLFSYLYPNLTLIFEEVDKNGNLQIKFSKQSRAIKVSKNSLIFNSDINWSFTSAPSSSVILPWMIWGIGKFLGLSSSRKDTPMNTSNLTHDYIAKYDLSVISGSITTSILHTFNTIITNVETLYGNPEGGDVIYGCVDSTATNYNSNATINDNSCVYEESALTATPSISTSRSYTRTESTNYILADAGTYLPVNTSLFQTSEAITNSADTQTALPVSITSEKPLISKVIIEQDDSIQYYVVASVEGEVEIFNTNAQKLSVDTSYTLTKTPHNLDRAYSSFNIAYQYSSEDNKHVLIIITGAGDSIYISLNDSMHQKMSGIEVPNCDDDTFTYGNAEVTSLYESKNYRAIPLVLEGLPDSFIVGGFSENIGAYVQSLGAEENAGLLGISYIEEFAPSLNNKKTFIFSFVERYFSGVGIGNISCTLDLFSNTVYIKDSALNNEDAALKATGPEIDEYENAEGDIPTDGVSNLKLLYTSKTTVLLRTYTGFSFDSFDFSMYSYSGTKWVDGGFVGDISHEIETTDDFTISNFITVSDHLKEYAELPVVIGNRCIQVDSITTAAENRSIWIQFILLSGIDAPLMPHMIGVYWTAVALKHGFILTKISNLFGVPLGPDAGGAEVHVPGGAYNTASMHGGWTPIAMVFSPNDNYLYTIIENPEDSTDKKICIYPIDGHSPVNMEDGVGVASAAYEVENPFMGDLSRVTVGVDGNVYFFSDSGTEYCKIIEPDTLSSVQAFSVFPIVLNSSITFDYYPTSHTLNPNLSAGEFNNLIPNGDNTSTDIPVGDPADIINNTEYPKLIISPTGTFNIDDNTFTPSDNDSEIWSVVATENESQTGALLYYAYITDSNDLHIKDREGTSLLDHPLTEYYSSTNRVFSIPSPFPLNSYIICYISDLVNNTGSYKKIFYRTMSFEYLEEPTGEGLLASLDLGTLEHVGSAGIVQNLDDDFADGLGIIRKDRFNYTCVIPTAVVDGDNYTVNIAFKDIKPYNFDIANAAAPSMDEDLGVYSVHDHPTSGGDLSTVISTSRDTTLLAVGTSSDITSTSIVSVHSYDSSSNTITTIATLDITLGTYIDGVIEDSYKIKSIEFSADKTKVYVLLTDSILAADGVESKILRLGLDVETNTLAWDGPLYNFIYTPEFAYEGHFTEGGNDTALAEGTKILSLYTGSDGAIYTVNNNLDSVVPTSGVILNSGNTPDSRIAKTARILSDTPGARNLGDVVFNFEDPTLDPDTFGPGEVAFGGSISLGCTDILACNYDVTANVDDGTCFYTDSSCACYIYSPPEGDPFWVSGDYHEECSECTYSAIVAEFDGESWEPWGEPAVSEVTLIGSSIGGGLTVLIPVEGEYNPEHCYTCLDENATNYDTSAAAGGCDLPDCLHVEDTCIYGVCDIASSPTACNAVTPAANETHVEDLCFYAASNCECVGDSAEPSVGYCGDCVSDPQGVVFQEGLEDSYCDCEGSPEASFCNCQGDTVTDTEAAYGCTCEWVNSGTSPNNIFENHAVCNCDGETPTDLGHGQYCDCDGNNLDSSLYCDDCVTEKVVYYQDPDDNGIASCSADYILACPGDTVDGYVQYTEDSTECEECGLDPETGVPAVKNCENVCKYLPGEPDINPDYLSHTLNDCDQCVPSSYDLTECCNVDYDDCGNCLDVSSSPEAQTHLPLGIYGATDIVVEEEPMVQYSYVDANGDTQTGTTCSCTGLNGATADTFESLEYDYCLYCDGDNTYSEDTGFITSLASGSVLKYCNCAAVANDTPIASGCCPGFQLDSCLGVCIPESQTLVHKDCNDECWGTAENDCAGVCGGTSVIGGCDNTCGSFLVDDFCGVCGGDDSSCTDCMNPDAINFCEGCTEETNISDDSLCEWYYLQEAINAVAIVEGPIEADLEGGTLLPTSASMDLTNIVDTLVLTNEEGVLIDNPDWTSKCQVISGNNLILHISNPTVNAELRYSILDFDNVVYNNVNHIIPVGTVASYTPVYYFRVDNSLNLVITDIESIFGSHADKIYKIKDTDNNYVDSVQGVLIPEGLTSIENTPYLNSGEDISNSVAGASPASYPGHKVYAVIPSVDDGGARNSFSVDFFDLLSEEDQEAFSLEYINPDITGLRVDVEVYTSIGLEDLKWVIYADNNSIVLESGDIAPGGFTEGVIRFSVPINSTQGCLYFLPIGFNKADVWEKANINIRNGRNTLHSLTFGNSDTPKGGRILHLSGDVCNRGCSPNTGIIVTDDCYIPVAKDVKEFTDIILNIATGGSDNNLYAGVKFYLYNLDSGKELVSVLGLNASSTISKSFRIDSDTRVGLKISNPNNVELVYSLVSESGKILLNKTLK